MNRLKDREAFDSVSVGANSPSLTLHTHTPTHTNTYITWRGRLSMRERIPNSTNRRLVRVKALMALVTFWIFLSRLGPDGTLLAVEEKKRHGAS